MEDATMEEEGVSDLKRYHAMTTDPDVADREGYRCISGVFCVEHERGEIMSSDDVLEILSAKDAELARLLAEHERLRDDVADLCEGPLPPTERDGLRAKIAFLEEALAEKDARIAELRGLLRLVIPNCELLHHEKADQHQAAGACPVEERIIAARERREW